MYERASRRAHGAARGHADAGRNLPLLAILFCGLLDPAAHRSIAQQRADAFDGRLETVRRLKIVHAGLFSERSHAS